MSDLNTIVKNMVAPTKGLLAADESTKTITKRFAALGLTSTPELNRQYRQTLLSTPGIEEYLSGVILFEETASQKLDSGELFPDYLQKKGILPGIKVDKGLDDFKEGEQVTKGLEGLKERLIKYKDMGFVFTKWRAAFKISDLYPSKECLEENLKRMTEYVKISLEAGLVPIPEPEVLIEGNHTTTRCAEITTDVLKILFEKLKAANINFSQIILKVNMVLPGKDNLIKAEPLEVAGATLRVLEKTLPPDLGGVVFLSGGQTPDQATKNLNEINKIKTNTWPLSFSFARALQNEAMEIWKGKKENVEAAQKAFLERCRLVSLARQGLLQ